MPLSACYLGEPSRSGLVLGYGGAGVPEIRDGVLMIPDGPGWGAEIDEKVLLEYPWEWDRPRVRQSEADAAAPAPTILG
jgi:hypothetical protein